MEPGFKGLQVSARSLCYSERREVQGAMPDQMTINLVGPDDVARKPFARAENSYQSCGPSQINEVPPRRSRSASQDSQSSGTGGTILLARTGTSARTILHAPHGVHRSSLVKVA